MSALRFNPTLQFLDHDRMRRWLLVDFDRDEPSIEDVPFRPEARIYIQRCNRRIAASNNDSASTLTLCSIPKLSENLTTQFRLNMASPGVD